MSALPQPELSKRGLTLVFALALVLAATLSVVLTGTGLAGAQDDGGTEPPAQPSGLRVATEPGSLEVAVDWDDVDGAADYLVRWRWVDKGEKLNDGVRVEDSAAGISVAGTGEWVVRVQACNDAGCGKPRSKRFTVEPAAEPTPTPTPEPTPEPTPAPAESAPGSPSNFAAVATPPGSRDVWARWDALDGADTYRLSWRKAGGEYAADDTTTVTGAATTATITVADHGRWVIKLEGCNDAGCGPGVEQAVGVTPGVPANFALRAAAGELDLSASWDALDGATSYRLSWRKAGGEFEADNTTTGATTTATITVADHGRWEVKLEGCNDAGCGAAVIQQADVAAAHQAGELRVSITASPANPRVNEATELSAVIRNAPEGETPSYSWEIEGNGEWQSYGRRATLRYLAGQPESFTFRVTVSYGSGTSATSDPLTVTWTEGPPNRAPVVDREAEYYSWFTEDNNAPRGTLVSKPFYGIFTDPDGDDLTYAVSITRGRPELVDLLRFHEDGGSDAAAAQRAQSGYPIENVLRVFFEPDGEADWKSLTPSLPDRPVITVTLTATDPGGLSASVSGDFIVYWESYPEVVSAVARGEAIELTFDWAVEANPAPTPDQFTVKVVNEDGTAGTIAVESVAVNGKVMTLGLAAAVREGQIATLDYAHAYYYDDHVALQRAGGGDAAPGFTGQAVEFLQPPGEPENFAVSAEPGSLDLSARWDALEGATSYRLRWRESGGEFAADNAATVTDANAAVTVPDYGEWDVRVQGCNGAGCGPEVEQAVTLVEIPVEPQNFAVSATAGSMDISATWDALEDAASYRLRWRETGGDFAADNDVTVSDTEAIITVPDYGEWEVRVQACNDAGCGPEASQTVAVVELSPPGEPQNFAVTVERGKLVVLATWDAVEGAASYRLRWRQSGGQFAADNAVTVSDTEATITMSDYGEWEVWLQACNDAGCVPEAGQPADEAPAVRLSLAPARDGQGQGQARAQSRSMASTAPRDPVEDETSYTLGWRRAGADAPTPSQPDTARQRRITDGPSGAGGPGAAGQPDTTAPRLVSGKIDGDTMTFYFSEPLDENATGSRFRVTLYFRNGWANFTAHPTRVEVSGNQVVEVSGNQVVEVSGNQVVVVGLSQDGWPGYERAPVGYPVQAYYYKDDRVTRASERLRDRAGNEVWTPHRSLGGHFPATRTIDLSNLTGPPRVQRATAHARWLTLTFNNRLDGNSVPAADAFTVTVNGSVVSLASVAPVVVSGKTVTLVLDSPVASTDVVTVSYAKPSDNPLRGPDGQPRSFSNRSVTNLMGTVPSVSQVEVTSDAGTDQTYAHGETIRVSLTFTEAVAVTGTPRLKINLDSDYGERWADYTGGTGTATLTFAYTVAKTDRATQGVAVLRDGLDLNGGSVRSTAAQKDAHLWYGGLDHDPDHMVDGAPPSLQSATMTEETRLTLRYNEILDEGSVPAASAFTVKVGGSAVSLASASPVTVAGDIVTLTLAAAVAEGDTVTVSYAKPASSADDKLKDPAGNEAASFNDQMVTFYGVASSPWIAAAKGTGLVLRYYRLLDEDSAPPVSAFTVKKTPPRGSEVTVSLSELPVISGRTLRLTLSSALAEGDTVTVSYTKPTSGVNNRLMDTAGNEVANFTDQMVSYDNTRPRLVRAEVDGAVLTQFYSEPLDEDSMPPASSFYVNLAWTEGLFTADEVAIIGNTAVLTLAHRAKVGQIVNTRYIHPANPSEQRLRDLAGNEVSVISGYYRNGMLIEPTRIITPDNLTVPSLERATVNRDRLTLTFDTIHMTWTEDFWQQIPTDSPLKVDPVPAASAFTVRVNGRAVSLASASPVAIAGSDVTLTLAAEVSSGDTVEVSYEKPDDNPLQKENNQHVASFADESVTNLTGDAS